jgi:hypothetical protein
LCAQALFLAFDCKNFFFDLIQTFNTIWGFMPRLVGKQSNKGLYVGLVLLAAIAGVIGMEYTGVINVVPGFGKEPSLVQSQR